MLLNSRTCKSWVDLINLIFKNCSYVFLRRIANKHQYIRSRTSIKNDEFIDVEIESIPELLKFRDDFGNGFS